MTPQKVSYGLHNLPLSSSGPLDCALTGEALLNTPYFNKGSAFPADERQQFNLTGLLPQNVQTLEVQTRRAYEQYCSRSNKLAKNTFLASLKEQNEVLYYKLLQDNIKEMFSVIYTPTEGDAIQNFSRLFRRPEGCFLNINDQDRVLHDLSQWGNADDIDYIVVTDGEEILGIGDQGVGGILISIAKLALATLCAGVHPNRCLPVVLDCGTDNPDLLGDDLYLGLRENRVRGKRYDDFVDTFVSAARTLYPKAYLHFEDFGLRNARRLLDLYRPRMPCFNDDVQGTGCVTLAAIMAGLDVSGQKLSDVRMVVFGAGSAGVGIADQVRDAIATQGHVSREEATKKIWLIDKPGLLTTATADTSGAQQSFLRDASEWNGHDTGLLSVVRRVRPNVLIGTSTVPGAFTRDVVRAMAESCPRPIIFPLSNPTRLHEATPADLLAWTDGAALVATGSPFDPVTGPWGPDGEEVRVEVAECNNSVVFPGVGLGCVLSRARLLTDRMMVAAVEGVAAHSPARSRPRAPLLPDVDAIRSVSLGVARRVVQAAVDEGVATQQGIPEGADELERWIGAQMWQPAYRPLRLVDRERASREARGELRKAGTVKRNSTLSPEQSRCL
ncbi:malic enzyme, NAD binding domain-containing protein [Hirsutella rhossiliensis]|uniref:Malic enzyme n=1 Tax=Hirsutella rhossiliensis TaxID=111463 RepID=A0A9P8SGN9_9HYPO|nr:malic enzyme, NAD binding domain-containing protein [Hirsutella rhossiliensis]KAH0962268.1 malic enzyme, NAD binding domain-containing protein [Hirsutella rhossiliensis]